MSQTTISAVLHRDLNTTPHTVFSASGHYLKLSDGAGGTRTVLDATGGAAVSCIGHCHPRVIAAMQEQISSLDYCASMFFSHAAGEALGTFLAESTGGKLPLSLILSSGSEAMETALKLARQYFLELPEPQEQRVRFIARNESYHGNSLGALGVGGHRSRRAKYEPLLSSNVSFVSACNAYRGMEEGESVAEYVARLKEELDQEFVRVGSDTVCAFVAEPVVGAAAGCVPAVEGYFKALREVCEKHGALLILDEVMCGMGRTGTLHAWEQEDVVPDIQTIGKGLGGGYTPAAAILVGKKVSDVLQSGSGKFMNGQTYQGHPLTVGASLEVQKIIQDENLLHNVKNMGDYLEKRLHERLDDHCHVGNIRGRGLFWGIELVLDRKTKKPFPAQFGLANNVHEAALTSNPGVMLYPGQGCVDGWSGDQLLIAPPYSITEAEIDTIVDGARKAIEEALAHAPNEMFQQ